MVGIICIWQIFDIVFLNYAIEYIPRKTKEGRPLTVRIPLNATAWKIVERYRKHIFALSISKYTDYDEDKRVNL